MVFLILMSTDMALGGAENQVLRLARRLVMREWKVAVVSMLPPEAHAEELAAAGIPLVSLNMRRRVADPRAFLRLVWLLRRMKPEVLATFMFHANVMGRLAGRIAGVPVIVSSVRTERFGGRLREYIMRITDRFADMTVANSRIAADHLVQRGVVPAVRLRVIPNGIQTQEYRVAPVDRRHLRTQLGVAHNEFLWLAVGRLEDQKDYPTLLKALRTVASQGKPVQLRVAGQGSLFGKLTTMAAELGMAERVRFLGLRTDVPALLQVADGLVMSSAWEGLPNAVMEALAAGIPVVATRVGGVPELIQDDISGFSVPPRDPQALAAAMCLLMSLPEAERKRMGEAGRDHVSARCDLDSVAHMWETLFGELLSRRRVRHEYGSDRCERARVRNR